MCGIFGAIGENINPEKIKTLMILNESRGKDSTGVFMIDSDLREITLKKAVTAKKYILSYWRDIERVFDCTKINIFMGHTRQATHGAVNDANAHPFEFNEENGRKIVGVHNGIIMNADTIEKKENHKGLEVDSMIIFYLLSKYDGDVNSLDPLTGYWGLAWYDYTCPGNLFLSNKNNGLYYTQVNGCLYFSSDDEHLKITFPGENVFLVTRGTVIKIGVDGLINSVTILNNSSTDETCVYTIKQVCTKCGFCSRKTTNGGYWDNDYSYNRKYYGKSYYAKKYNKNSKKTDYEVMGFDEIPPFNQIENDDDDDTVWKDYWCESCKKSYWAIEAIPDESTGLFHCPDCQDSLIDISENDDDENDDDDYTCFYCRDEMCGTPNYINGEKYCNECAPYIDIDDKPIKKEKKDDNGAAVTTNVKYCDNCKGEMKKGPLYTKGGKHYCCDCGPVMFKMSTTVPATLGALPKGNTLPEKDKVAPVKHEPVDRCETCAAIYKRSELSYFGKFGYCKKCIHGAITDNVKKGV